MTYKIENNIPLSPVKGGPVAGPWPWADMQISQSVFIPAKNGETSATIRRRVHPYTFGKRNDQSFATRWVEKNGKTGLRVWRTR